MKRYKYKNIKVYRAMGGWCAEYVENNRRFALHSLCQPTRYMAYNSAKREVDYLNRKEI